MARGPGRAAARRSVGTRAAGRGCGASTSDGARAPHEKVTRRARHQEARPRLTAPRRAGERGSAVAQKEPDGQPVVVLQPHGTVGEKVGHALSRRRRLELWGLVEDPAHVRVPPAGAPVVRIGRAVRVAVVNTVLPCPPQRLALQRAARDEQERPREGAAGLVGAVAEKPVVAGGDGQTEEEVRRDRKLVRAARDRLPTERIAAQSGGEQAPAAEEVLRADYEHGRHARRPLALDLREDAVRASVRHQGYPSQGRGGSGGTPADSSSRCAPGVLASFDRLIQSLR